MKTSRHPARGRIPKHVIHEQSVSGEKPEEGRAGFRPITLSGPSRQYISPAFQHSVLAVGNIIFFAPFDGDSSESRIPEPEPVFPDPQIQDAVFKIPERPFSVNRTTKIVPGGFIRERIDEGLHDPVFVDVPSGWQ